MPLAVIQQEYDQEAQEFTQELLEAGRLASFGRQADGNESWSPSGDYEELTTAYILQSEWKKDFSDNVKADDLIFFVSQPVQLIDDKLEPDLESELNDCSIMVDQGRQYRIIKNKPFQPGQNIIFSELQVRA